MAQKAGKNVQEGEIIANNAINNDIDERESASEDGGMLQTQESVTVKSKKGPRWEKAEMDILVKYCKRHYDILEGNLKEASLHNKDKLDRWDYIVQKVNRYEFHLSSDRKC